MKTIKERIEIALEKMDRVQFSMYYSLIERQMQDLLEDAANVVRNWGGTPNPYGRRAQLAKKLLEDLGK